MQSHALQKKTATRYAQCCCVRQTARVARIGTPTTVTAAPAPTSLSPPSPTSTPCRRRRVQRVMPPSRGLHELPLHHHRAPPGAAAAAAMAAIALLALTGSFLGTLEFSFRTKPFFCSFETFTLYDSYYEYESTHSTLYVFDTIVSFQPAAQITRRPCVCVE